MHQLYIISDGTGMTAKRAVKAALTQFEDSEIKLNLRPNIRSENQVLEVIIEAGEANGFIVHTVVSKKLRNKILEISRLHNVETIDIMGPLLAQLSHQFANLPSEKPGLFHELNKSYFQRIEAIEFTFRHDDGLKPEELKKAEIVLIGVSRTFKTPLSIYLAFKGWRVANIPIVLDIKPPDILFEISPEKVFCLTTYPKRLVQLRIVRNTYLGGGTGNYAEFDYVQKELRYAQILFSSHPMWSVIKVTDKPIEEIASEILKLIKNRKG